jgi:cytochrome c-type biogenesis protein CcmH/NrfG
MPDEHAGAAATVERYRSALSRASRARSRGDLADALTAYQFALHLKPRSTDAALGVARTYLEAEQGQDALRWAERARDLEHRGIDGRLLVGDALLLMGQHQRAVQAWEEAARVSPRSRAPAERIRRAEEALLDD